MIAKFQSILRKVFIITLFLCIQMQALVYSIENQTDGQIHIFLEYEAESLCTPAERLIEKNKSATIKAGPCLARQIIIQGSGVLHEIPKPTSSAAIQNCTITISDKKSQSSSYEDESKFFITISYQK